MNAPERMLSRAFASRQCSMIGRVDASLRLSQYFFSHTVMIPGVSVVDTRITLWGLILCFYTPPLLKVEVLCYTLHSKNASECPSVWPSVCTSVRQRIVFTLCWERFNQFSSNLLWELTFGRSVLGSQMGKLWQISTEFRPLIDVGNWFSLTIFGIPLPIFFKLGLRVNILKECSGIADG